MTVRAHARRDLALIFRTAWPEAENHHHAVSEADAPRAGVHPVQVRTNSSPGPGHESRSVVAAVDEPLLADLTLGQATPEPDDHAAGIGIMVTVVLEPLRSIREKAAPGRPWKTSVLVVSAR